MVDVVIVAWHLFSLLEDAFYSFSFKALDMLMLKLQDGVSSHDLCADVMLFLVHHQRVVLVCVSLVGYLLIFLKLLLQEFLEFLLFIVSELAERADRPGIVKSDIFQSMVRLLLLDVKQLLLTVHIGIRRQDLKRLPTARGWNASRVAEEGGNILLVSAGEQRTPHLVDHGRLTQVR